MILSSHRSYAFTSLFIPLTTPTWQVAHSGVIQLEDGKREAQVGKGIPQSNKRAKSLAGFDTEREAQDVDDGNAHEYGMLTSAEQNQENRALNSKQKVVQKMDRILLRQLQLVLF